MKKIAALCAAAMIAFGTQAQTTKGTIALTGRFGYTQQKADSEKYSENDSYTLNSYDYTISPAIGVFVRDNLEIGATSYLTRNKSESLSTNVSYIGESLTEVTREGYRVYAKQYKFITERFAMHATLSAGLENMEYKHVFTNSNYANVYQMGNHQDKSSGFSASLSPGLSFFASNKIGLSVNLGALRYSRSESESLHMSRMYSNEPDRSETAYTSNIVDFDFSSLNLNFGLTYFLGK